MPKYLLFIILSVALLSCGEDEVYTPKPRGYFRIDLPKTEYQTFESSCPFTFEVSKNSAFAKHHSNNNCWFNIVYPKLNATIHISYNNLNNDLKTYTESSRALVYKHTSKAQYINEKFFNKPENKVYGIMYEIGGNAASNCQFFLTDSTNHFIRGALYFSNTPNMDSLAPVLDFVKNDIVKLIETTRWK